MIPILTMRKYLFSFFSLLIFFSCSSLQKIERPFTLENVDGVIIITSRACFFIPNDYCDYLSYDNSKEDTSKAVILYSISNLDELVLEKSLIAQINILPNKDSTDIVVLYDKCNCRNDDINENDIIIFSAKVSLTTFSKPINVLADSCRVKFKWYDTVYYYECFQKGDFVNCEILSINKKQQEWIINTKTLPNGIIKSPS